MSLTTKLLNVCIDMSETEMYRFCRVCLNDSHSYSRIFEEMLLDDCLYEVLNDVCQLQVKVNDGLPEFVCFECYKRISEFEKFKRQSHEGNATLQRMKDDFENVQVKLEADSYEVDPLREERMNEVDIQCPAKNYFKVKEETADDGGIEAVLNKNYFKVKEETADDGGIEAVLNKNYFKVKEETADDGGIEAVLNKVSNVPACLHEEDEMNIKAEWSNQGCIESEINNIQEEAKEEESFGKREKLGLNLEVCAAPIVRNDSTSEDMKESKVCVISNYVELKENDKKGRLINEKTRINENVEDQGPEGSLSNCGEYGRNRSKDDCQKQPSRIMNTRKTVNDSNLGSDSKAAQKIKYVEDKSDKPVVALNKTNNLGGKNMGKVKYFVCDTCKKVFHFKSTLAVHLTVHTREKPYKSPICNGAFNRKGNLRKHKVVHNYGGSHICNVCGKSFKEDWYLKQHMKACSKKKKFLCVPCNKTCSTQSNLNTRIKLRSHSNIFPCVTCGMTFKSKSTFYRHRASHIHIVGTRASRRIAVQL